MISAPHNRSGSSCRSSSATYLKRSSTVILADFLGIPRSPSRRPDFSVGSSGGSAMHGSAFEDPLLKATKRPPTERQWTGAPASKLMFEWRPPSVVAANSPRASRPPGARGAAPRPRTSAGAMLTGPAARHPVLTLTEWYGPCNVIGPAVEESTVSAAQAPLRPRPNAGPRVRRPVPPCTNHPKPQLCCIERTAGDKIPAHHLRLMYRCGRLVIFRSVLLWPVSPPSTASNPAKACHLKRLPNPGGSLVLPFCSVL